MEAVAAGTPHPPRGGPSLAAGGSKRLKLVYRLAKRVVFLPNQHPCTSAKTGEFRRRC